jgi:hypothetical protein
VIELTVDLYDDRFQVCGGDDLDTVVVEREGEFTPDEVGRLWEGLELVVIVNDYRKLAEPWTVAAATYRYGDVISQEGAS